MIDWATNPQETRDWARNFFQVEPELLFEIVVAADFLDVEDLLDCACETIAIRIAGKSAPEMKKIFNFKADIMEDGFEVSQERQVQCEHPQLLILL